MTSYHLRATIRTINTDEVDVRIEAKTEHEAFERASKALSMYPEIQGKSIPYLYVDSRTVEATEVISIRPDREEE